MTRNRDRDDSLSIFHSDLLAILIAFLYVLTGMDSDLSENPITKSEFRHAVVVMLSHPAKGLLSARQTTARQTERAGERRTSPAPDSCVSWKIEWVISERPKLARNTTSPFLKQYSL